MSGLICAIYLEKRGIKSTVFDTGIHGLGGRMGTRSIDPQGLIFDHAAQFFTVSDPEFAEMVSLWSKNGVDREWHGAVGELEAGGRFTPFPPSPPRYIGVNGIHPLADSILSQTSMVNVLRPCWISKLEPYNGKWFLSENGKPRGDFDTIVIAHNGKCANRLLASSGLPLIARQMKHLRILFLCRVLYWENKDKTQPRMDHKGYSSRSCKDDLAAAHKHCAETWFKIKGNKLKNSMRVEICWRRAIIKESSCCTHNCDIEFPMVTTAVAVVLHKRYKAMKTCGSLLDKVAIL